MERTYLTPSEKMQYASKYKLSREEIQVISDANLIEAILPGLCNVDGSGRHLFVVHKLKGVSRFSKYTVSKLHKALELLQLAVPMGPPENVYDRPGRPSVVRSVDLSMIRSDRTFEEYLALLEKLKASKRPRFRWIGEGTTVRCNGVTVEIQKGDVIERPDVIDRLERKFLVSPNERHEICPSCSYVFSVPNESVL